MYVYVPHTPLGGLHIILNNNIKPLVTSTRAPDARALILQAMTPCTEEGLTT